MRLRDLNRGDIVSFNFGDEKLVVMRTEDVPYATDNITDADRNCPWLIIIAPVDRAGNYFTFNSWHMLNDPCTMIRQGI